MHFSFCQQESPMGGRLGMEKTKLKRIKLSAKVSSTKLVKRQIYPVIPRYPKITHPMTNLCSSCGTERMSDLPSTVLVSVNGPPREFQPTAVNISKICTDTNDTSGMTLVVFLIEFCIQCNSADFPC